jgi:hypothetical protein
MLKKKFFLVLLLKYLFPLIAIYSQQNLSTEEQAWIQKASRIEKNGWIYLHIEGKPFVRGFQHGYLLANEIAEAIRVEKFSSYWNTGKEYQFFVKNTFDMFKGKIDPEYKEEMEGITAGVNKAGIQESYGDIVLLNASMEIFGYWYPWLKDDYIQKHKTGGCSAFIATGKSTADGGIVMVHNTWCDYINADCYVILDIQPEKGARIFMQSYPGAIHSGTDFFITDAGMVGTETTISSFKGFDTSAVPEFIRIRKAMQYGNNIDDYNKILIEKNNGGYANTWLYGDIKTGEIARLELGLENYKIERTFDGFYTGSNITMDMKILRDETEDNYDDIRNSNVARRIRWKQLFEKNYGKVNVETAKAMLGDHYDVYLKKDFPNIRSICGHGDLESGDVYSKWGIPFYPMGSVDAKVVDTKLAKEMKFWAKWGSSCDIPFDAKKFIKDNQQFDYLDGYLMDRPFQPWTLFEVKR